VGTAASRPRTEAAHFSPDRPRLPLDQRGPPLHRKHRAPAGQGGSEFGFLGQGHTGSVAGRPPPDSSKSQPGKKKTRLGIAHVRRPVSGPAASSPSPPPMITVETDTPWRWAPFQTRSFPRTVARGSRPVNNWITVPAELLPRPCPDRQGTRRRGGRPMFPRCCPSSICARSGAAPEMAPPAPPPSPCPSLERVVARASRHLSSSDRIFLIV